MAERREHEIARRAPWRREIHLLAEINIQFQVAGGGADASDIRLAIAGEVFVIPESTDKSIANLNHTISKMSSAPLRS